MTEEQESKEAVSDDFINRFGIGWWEASSVYAFAAAIGQGKVFAVMTQEKLKELELHVNDLEAELAAQDDAIKLAEFIDSWAPGDGPTTEVVFAAERILKQTRKV